ncbi:AAA family ATPase [Parvibaculum lavamentivorans]|nr:ATP-binding protein [Parvibaculum lavamentivorans]
MARAATKRKANSKKVRSQKKVFRRVYAENFRGFAKIDFQIKDVTFVVGDNSSGKTSLIYLLSVIASRDFGNQFDIFSDSSPLSTIDDVRSPFVTGDKTVVGFSLVRRHFDDSGEERASVEARFAEYTHSGKHECVATKIGALRDKQARFVLRKNRTFYRKNVTIEEGAVEKKIESFFEGWSDESLSYNRYISFPPTLEISGEHWSVVLVDVDKEKNSISMPYMRTTPLVNFIQYGPMRISPEHVYSGHAIPQDHRGAHTPAMLKKIYDSRKTSKSSRIIEKINKFGVQSGMFDQVIVNSYNKRDSKAPFGIHIEKRGHIFSIDEVGYGVSQVLPIIIDAIRSIGSSDTMISIQQPELHLHPKAQAAFGELVYELAGEGIAFFIETHSDYIIDRFRYCLFKSKKEAGFESGILLSENTPEGNRISEINIDGNGGVSDAPSGYREFFLQEDNRLFDMLWR